MGFPAVRRADDQEDLRSLGADGDERPVARAPDEEVVARARALAEDDDAVLDCGGALGLGDLEGDALVAAELDLLLHGADDAAAEVVGGVDAGQELGGQRGGQGVEAGGVVVAEEAGEGAARGLVGADGELQQLFEGPRVGEEDVARGLEGLPVGDRQIIVRADLAEGVGLPGARSLEREDRLPVLGLRAERWERK